MSAATNARPWQKIEVARVVLEFESAFLVASGEGDGLHDAVFCADANGLPALPGDSIAGILRHALAGENDPATDPKCCEVFGNQEGTEGKASRARVSWGQVHGADDRPVPFRAQAPLDDPVLAFLAAGVPRDRVRIGPHGAASSRGKFDELLVPAGTRFTFELVVDRAHSGLSAADLIALLQLPHVCMGGGTHHGLGRFRVARAAARVFDLSLPADRQAYGALPAALEDGDGGVLAPLPAAEPAPATGWVIGSVRLRPLDTWMIGGGNPCGREPPRGEDEGGKTEWDRVPLTERRISWTRYGAGDRGRVSDVRDAPFLIPGSAIRGVLRHRVAFHSRRLALAAEIAAGGRRDADEHARDWPLDLEATEEEAALFGAARGDENGRPGAVTIGDTWLEPAAARFAPMQHVSLDRFTQGPMDGLLFDEAPLHGGEIRFEIGLRRPASLTTAARRALGAALGDLCGGRLRLGAGRGHGGFRGSIEWSDGGRWQEDESA